MADGLALDPAVVVVAHRVPQAHDEDPFVVQHLVVVELEVVQVVESVVDGNHRPHPQ